MRLLIVLSMVLGFTLACGGAETPPAAVAPAASPAPAPIAPVTAWVAPILPKCDTNRLLTEYDFAYLKEHYCELCKAEDEMACEMDWPTNDVPACALWDEMRNGIYATYGYPFQKTVWKETFKAFWTENPAYSEAMLSPAAARNVALLKDMADKQMGCAG